MSVSDRLELRLPPPLVGATLALAMWAVAPAVEPGSPAPGWRMPAAALLAACGLAFDLAGLMAFRAGRTTVNPLRPQNTSALVTGGVYRLTRNPMYLGLLLMLSGWATWLGGAPPWAGPVLFVLVVGRFQIAPEERVLRERFGDAFDAYCRRVRRWL